MFEGSWVFSHLSHSSVLVTRGALGFSILRFRPFFRSFFRFLYQKTSVLVSVAVCGFCSILLSVFGKNKMEFSDLLLDALRYFSGFSSENMRLKDLNRVHVFSDFACSFRF